MLTGELQHIAEYHDSLDKSESGETFLVLPVPIPGCENFGEAVMRHQDEIEG
jgi:hypothetical protein